MSAEETTKSPEEQIQALQKLSDLLLRRNEDYKLALEAQDTIITVLNSQLAEYQDRHSFTGVM